MFEFSHPLMETEEYKELFEQAKSKHPTEYDYFLQVSCLAHLVKAKEEREKSHDIIKCDVNIETQDEVQKEHTSE